MNRASLKSSSKAMQKAVEKYEKSRLKAKSELRKQLNQCLTGLSDSIKASDRRTWDGTIAEVRVEGEEIPWSSETAGQTRSLFWEKSPLTVTVHTQMTLPDLDGTETACSYPWYTPPQCMDQISNELQEGYRTCPEKYLGLRSEQGHVDSQQAHLMLGTAVNRRLALWVYNEFEPLPDGSARVAQRQGRRAIILSNATATATGSRTGTGTGTGAGAGVGAEAGNTSNATQLSTMYDGDDDGDGVHHVLECVVPTKNAPRIHLRFIPGSNPNDPDDCSFIISQVTKEDLELGIRSAKTWRKRNETSHRG